jgi:hypothetical protein
VRHIVLGASLAAAVLAGACSAQSGGHVVVPTLTGPASAPSTFARPLSLVIGTWTGTETASVGESGNLTVVFTQEPANDAVVAATITFEGSIMVHGTLSGTLDNMAIVATDGPAGVCAYTAHGVLNEAGTQITGDYVGSGDGPNCSHKAGTFILNGQSFVAQQTCGTTSYYQMLNGSESNHGQAAGGNGKDPKQTKCENSGGTWLGNFNGWSDVCKFSPNPPGNPGQDMQLLESTPIACVS